MPNIALLPAEKPEEVQNEEHFTSQEPLPGESMLWYNRYLLYRDMGSKRSLRAAVADERARVHQVKEPEKATKPVLKVNKTIKALPKPAPEPVHVPGSWKNAARVYHWRERCQAYELSMRKVLAQRHEAQLADTYGNRYRRIRMLDGLIKQLFDVLQQFLQAKERSSAQYIAYVKLLQSLLDQMERESASPDVSMSIEAWAATKKEQIDQLITGAKNVL